VKAASDTASEECWAHVNRVNPLEAADDDDEMARFEEEERKIDETYGVGRLRQMRTAVRNKDTAGEE
jgi:hypothetical protein